MKNDLSLLLLFCVYRSRSTASTWFKILSCSCHSLATRDHSWSRKWTTSWLSTNSTLPNTDRILKRSVTGSGINKKVLYWLVCFNIIKARKLTIFYSNSIPLSFIWSLLIIRIYVSFRVFTFLFLSGISEILLPRYFADIPCRRSVWYYVPAAFLSLWSQIPIRT